MDDLIPNSPEAFKRRVHLRYRRGPAADGGWGWLVLSGVVVLTLVAIVTLGSGSDPRTPARTAAAPPPAVAAPVVPSPDL